MKLVLFQKNVLAAVFGNSLEWYDFVLYGSLAPFLAQHFFPTDNHLTSLMLTFAVFAVGFLFRPIGGILFSHFGDTRGRRKTLIASMILMGVPTVLIGLIPSYQTIGATAPILILCIRAFQGLSVGGEYAGSISYLFEIAEKKERGFYSSLVQVGLFSGILIGPIIIKIVMAFTTTETFAAWGWRIPFLCGAILGLIAYFLCRHISETDAFIAIQKEVQHKIPLAVCLREYKMPMITGFLIAAQVGISFWLVIVYFVTYFSKILHAPFDIVETQNLWTILIALILTPFLGKLSKIISSWMILFIASILFIAFSYVLNEVIVNHVLTTSFYLANFCLMLFSITYLSAFSAVLAALFPTQVRYSGIAFSYNISLAIFGGLSPLVVTALIQQGVILAPGILLTIGGVLSIIALIAAKKYAKY
ncbi:MAG TPA: MFS transporter [Coxiellaceae bacterium]|nr:MAG: hypothetical protein A3E81_00780 [Gammaproteobacteria bacterium RIFCSPHIGHO2_12_FULL_36_30]HLB56694.1 MFS transporter [Coxiellaceae bacterium]